MVHTWNTAFEATPPDSQDALYGATRLRELKVAVRERLELLMTMTTGAFVNSLLNSGRKLWFYEDSAPSGWTIVAGTGDEMLATKGGSTYTTGGSQQGTWSMAPTALTSLASNMHFIMDGSGLSGYVPWYASDPGGTTKQTSLGGGGTVSSFRPLARVGIICSKD